MKSFLEHVAADLLSRYSTNLSRVAVVFPNKRASLFLNEHLARLAGQPLWSPAYITISDLFRRNSRRTVADPIKLVCDLHKSFTSCTGIDETLDHFYGWGELLISDFDDIDKNMADAKRVFTNLGDLHELDDVSYLNEEQRAMLRRFFGNFTETHNTELKERFLFLWSRFYDIYTDFNQRLSCQQLAYEGSLYREVALDETIEFDYDMYLFVGFNMIQRAEQMLCRRLMRQGKARFYWDFDHYYMRDLRHKISGGTGTLGTSWKSGKSGESGISANLPPSEAGHYISQYLSEFPNELDSLDDDIYNQLGAAGKHFSFISAPTENIQARYVATWLRENNRIGGGRRTAVVMCNEGLLQTVLHCIPSEVEKVNVTTGYPLSQTPVASFIMLLLSGNRSSLMRHPYHAYAPDDAQPDVAAILGAVRAIANDMKRETEAAGKTDPLDEESLFRAYTLLNRVYSLIVSGDLICDRITLQRLVGQIIQNTSIPFHGEPAVGIQVMGVLETRNLDFDHLLILSCNEGNMPKGVNDSSFIPYSIRKAFGLTTIDNKVAIYAYYFHRLIQRANDVTMVYNNSTEDGHTGEMSRFMIQLMVESGHQITTHALQAGQVAILPSPKAINKSPRVADCLQHLTWLSPTAINRYLRCQLQFYYYHIVGIRESDENEDDEIDNRIFGNIFHRASEFIYRDIMARRDIIQAADVDEVLRHPEQIEMAVDKAIAEELFKIKDGGRLPALNGLQLINRQVIIHYVGQLLRIDRSLAPFAIKGLELKVRRTICAGAQRLDLGGVVDRLDLVDIGRESERIRVVDYKTGRLPHRKVAVFENIFNPSLIGDMHTDYYLQAMLYSLIVSSDEHLNSKHLPVSPALLFIQHSQADGYDPTLLIGKERIDDIEMYRSDFMENIERVLMEIFNIEQPFTPTDDKERCAKCPYKLMCGV